jgi:arylsulfatase
MSRRDFLKLSAATAATGVFGNLGCHSSSSGSSNTSAIMIVVDTLRADHLSVLGYGRNTSPNLGEFSYDTYIFSNAISAAPWTLPSYASLMTGMLAYNHCQNEYLRPFTRKTLVDLIAEADYETIAVHTNGIFSNLTYIFDETYKFASPNQNEGDAIAVETAIDWLRRSATDKNPFFMLLWLISPHSPYQTNSEIGYLEEFVSDIQYQTTSSTYFDVDCDDDGAIKAFYLSPAQREIVGPPVPLDKCYHDSNLYIAAYDANIRYVDYQVGRFINALKELDLYNDLMIIFLGDHGEDMVDHERYFSHGCNLYHSLIHVPLFIKFPGQKESFWIDTPVRTIDALPTFLDKRDIDPGAIDGKSLIPVINEYACLENRPCISFLKNLDTGHGDIALTTGTYKLIKTYFGDKFYNLVDDPAEEYDIADEYPEIVYEMNDYLSEFYRPFP